jgi:hypothetical protein
MGSLFMIICPPEFQHEGWHKDADTKLCTRGHRKGKPGTQNDPVPIKDFVGVAIKGGIRFIGRTVVTKCLKSSCQEAYSLLQQIPKKSLTPNTIHSGTDIANKDLSSNCLPGSLLSPGILIYSGCIHRIRVCGYDASDCVCRDWGKRRKFGLFTWCIGRSG